VRWKVLRKLDIHIDHQTFEMCARPLQRISRTIKAAQSFQNLYRISRIKSYQLKSSANSRNLRSTCFDNDQEILFIFNKKTPNCNFKLSQIIKIVP
jgi:hypothetical protein